VNAPGHDLGHFATTVLLGTAVAIVLDVARHLGRRLRPSWRHLADLAAWGVAMMVFFPPLYASGSLVLRFSVVFGAGVGALLYFGLAAETIASWLGRPPDGAGRG
jgi:hypothetical protein